MAAGRLRIWMILVLALAFGAIAANASDTAEPMIVVFYEQGCPDCDVIEGLIRELAIDLPTSAIETYGITEPGALDLFIALAAAYDIEADRVPTVFVGDEAIVGAGRAVEFSLRAAIGTCTVRGCPSPLDRIRPAGLPWSDVLRLAAIAALLALLIVLQPL